MSKITIFTLASLISFSLISIGLSAQDSDLNTRISNLVDKLVSDNEIPGLNLSLIYGDGRQENFSSGYADIEKGVKMNPGFVMFSGSIGKTYAVALLMQLVEEGQIDLEEKFVNYFPDTEWLSMLPNIDDITIKMLLQHTSGLPRYVMKPGVWEALHSDPDKIWSYRDRLSFVFNDMPLHEAGKGWGYSDTNYILLGMLIEKITGLYYYDLLKLRIIDPFSLSNTFAADTRSIDNLPVGYSRLPDLFKMPEKMVVDGVYAFNPQMEWTGGGIASTTSDLARWADIYYNSNLIPEKLRKMIVTPNPDAPLEKGGAGYGMGSFIFDTGNGIAYGHTGFVPGFNSVFAWYPDRNIAIALQVNCDYATAKISLMDYLSAVIELLEQDQ